MSSRHDSGFDFNLWAEAARSDPEQFERMRSELLREFIDEAPQNYRHRLSGLQFKLDLERRRAKTPLAACIRISQLMLNKLHDEFIPALRMEPSAIADPTGRAQVIDFDPARRRH